jgi:UDP-N-acetylmuramate--alanine ligase
MIILNNKRRIHFVGIGGAGMSGLGEMLLSLGFTVTGSDRQSSSITERLGTLGIRIQYNHEPALVADADIVVYSSAIRSDNAELIYAKAHGIPLMKRAEMLGEFMRTKFSVGVAGTHGKTTTTSLIGHILHEAGLNPTVVVGGTVKHFDANAIMGTGEIMVVEADEYDRSFLKMFPSIAVVTNIEADHLDCYSGIDEIKKAFTQFMNSTPFYGAIVACIDEQGVKDVLKNCVRPLITYGIDRKADYNARNVTFTGSKTIFDFYHKDKFISKVTLPVPGMHNVKNCCAALAVTCELGVEVSVAVSGLLNFSGVRRRFEVVGKTRGITIVDDYAHHPSEIRATLLAAKNCGFKRIIAVFQPHLYTRTRDFMDQFAESLCLADIVIVTEIYKSREDRIPGISATTLVEKIVAKGCNVKYVEKKDDIASLLLPQLSDGDGVIIMGAGDIWETGRQLAAEIKNA